MEEAKTRAARDMSSSRRLPEEGPDGSVCWWELRGRAGLTRRSANERLIAGI